MFSKCDQANAPFILSVKERTKDRSGKGTGLTFFALEYINTVGVIVFCHLTNKMQKNLIISHLLYS